MKESAPGALDLFEEAVSLLRRADAGTMLCYYTGSLPFILFFLYFWGDMSSSGLAAAHLPEMSLAVALLYLWMKCWHSMFASRLRARLQDFESALPGWRKCSRMILIQSIAQSTSLFVIPFSFLVLLPFGWVYAFYRNITALGDGEEASLKTVLQDSWKLARLWPFQNHKILCLAPILGLVVFLNAGILLLFGPELLHLFLGIETLFRMSGFHMLNTTFLAVCAGLGYLCLNPLLLAVYVLRCFHGQAQQTGADLKTQLLQIAYE